MPVSSGDIRSMEERINARLEEYKSSFILSFHVAVERLNDARNRPPITIEELESVFNRLIDEHILAIVALNDGDTFNIRCLTSDINMPCGVRKQSLRGGGSSQKNIVITIIRKRDFKSKDPIEFAV